MNVDVIIATYNRAHILTRTISEILKCEASFKSIIVVNNNSSDNTCQVMSEFACDKLTLINCDKNYGAAGGKNIGLRSSSSDIAVVLDDDAFFNTENPIEEIINFFSANSKLAIMQFKIVNYKLNRMLDYEFPAPSIENYSDKVFKTGYFIGAGHAIRMSALKRIGFYPDDFGLYAHEELDLSYRCINAGYDIMYSPYVGVFHMKEPAGRLPPPDVLYNMYYYRLVLSFKYLPIKYLLICNTLWFFKTMLDSKSLILPIRVINNYLKNRYKYRKSKLSDKAVRYLENHFGRLYK